MTRLHRLFTTLFAALLLAACGGQPTVENAPEPTEAPVAEATDMLVEEANESAAADGETVESDEGFPITVTDMTGRELTVEAPPERIVCLYNRCVQELAFMGVAPVAVGAPWTYNVALDPVNFGEEAESFGQITQDPEINWEQVVSYQPDLIIGDESMEDAAEGISPLYAITWDPRVEENVENFTADVRNYSRLFGIEEEVDTKIQNVLDRVAAYAELSPNDRTHLVVDLDGGTGSTVSIPPNCGLFLSQLSPCSNSDGTDRIEGSIETLLSFDPDVLIVEQYNVNDEEAMLENLAETNPLWNELTAVQNGNVYLVPVSQARTNSIQAVQGAVDAIMPLIYPDTFDGPLTDEEVQEILTE